MALSGRFSASWDTRGVEEQLRFLGQVHDVRTVVLIAHASCAYYSQRLAIPAQDLEREQIDDLRKATMAVNRLLPKVDVQRYFARRSGTEVSFEPVQVRFP